MSLTRDFAVEFWDADPTQYDRAMARELHRAIVRVEKAKKDAVTFIRLHGATAPGLRSVCGITIERTEEVPFGMADIGKRVTQ